MIRKTVFEGPRLSFPVVGCLATRNSVVYRKIRSETVTRYFWPRCHGLFHMCLGSILENRCGSKQYHRATRPGGLKSIMADWSQCALTWHRHCHKSDHAHANGREDSISCCSCLRHNRLVDQLSSSHWSGCRRTEPNFVTHRPGSYLVTGVLLRHFSSWNIWSHWHHACYNGVWRVQGPLCNEIQAHNGAADTHAADHVLLGICIGSCRSLLLYRKLALS